MSFDVLQGFISAIFFAEITKKFTILKFNLMFYRACNS